MKRYGYIVCGQVQGVGFRPFVFRVAERLGLTGHVGNTSDGVRVEVQGCEEDLDSFEKALREELPVLAHITSQKKEILEGEKGEKAFQIIQSEGRTGHTVLVSPDVATCETCLKEIRDQGNRRYAYPFTNCTDCGPRFTITKSIPYDRASTSMECFSLCPECRAEYENPHDRRFHAQPNACPVCGPKVWIVRPSGEGCDEQRNDEESIRIVAQEVASGKIVAIKGLGGFHLACDAFNADAIEHLRVRKIRPHQSFAVMVRDLESARRLAIINDAEATALQSIERPIVVLTARKGALPAGIAPDLQGEPEDQEKEDQEQEGQGSIGIMLPYTPLHHLLLLACSEYRIPALVMTSGNRGGEPIALGNREAISRLEGIADLFLVHNRDILVRADDSVVRVLSEDVEEKERKETSARYVFFRRSRGFTPRPLPLVKCFGEEKKNPRILATGAELKNTICLTRGNEAFVSQHVGDLKNMETEAFFCETIRHLAGLLEVNPELVVCDRHPDARSSVWARESGLPVLQVQHHFAHIHSVLAEHEHIGPALGLALDGTGYGDDGTIWGGELLLVRPERLGRSDAASGTTSEDNRRIGRLAPFPLPGGDSAIREPWRLVAGLCAVLGVEFPERIRQESHLFSLATGIAEMVRHGTLQTSSCGRLFDAVAALLGVCEHISYEGQAAIRLEQIQAKKESKGLPVSIREQGDLFELDTGELFRYILKRREAGDDVSVLARRFHLGIAEGLADLADAGARSTGIRTVALSGGVLYNLTLARHLESALRRRGLSPLTHRSLPPGDGGISFGQAAWGRYHLLK